MLNRIHDLDRRTVLLFFAIFAVALLALIVATSGGDVVRTFGATAIEYGLIAA